MTDVIVTGLPRSGLTSVAALIDGLPDSACLNTPYAHVLLALQAQHAEAFSQSLINDFAETRSKLLSDKSVRDFRSYDGNALIDGLHDPDMPADSNREPMAVPFKRAGLTHKFILGAKHHTLYTSALPALVKTRHFKIIAVIRHPLEVFASWRALSHPLFTSGRPSGISQFWPEALAIVSANTDSATQHVQLYDLYLQRYHELREHIHVIKFEDVIDDPNLVSRLFGSKAISANAGRMRIRTSRQFDSGDMQAYRGAIQKYGVYSKLYYGKL